jgi:hypothetical protein
MHTSWNFVYLLQKMLWKRKGQFQGTLTVHTIFKNLNQWMIKCNNLKKAKHNMQQYLLWICIHSCLFNRDFYCKKKTKQPLAEIRIRKFSFQPYSHRIVVFKIKMPEYRKKVSPTSLVLPLVCRISPTSAFRHRRQSGTADHGLFR